MILLIPASPQLSIGFNHVLKAETRRRLFHVSRNCDYANGYSIDATEAQLSESEGMGSALSCCFLRDGTVLSIKSIPGKMKIENKTVSLKAPKGKLRAFGLFT